MPAWLTYSSVHSSDCELGFWLAAEKIGADHLIVRTGRERAAMQPSWISAPSPE
jgi:hypothetical protein